MPESFQNETEFVRHNQHWFLQKPCSVQVLLRAVRRCLDERETLEPLNKAAGPARIPESAPLTAAPRNSRLVFGKMTE